MKNTYQTQNLKIIKVEKEENGKSKLFTIKRPRGFSFEAGQFVMVSIPGLGEAPISITSSPEEKANFQLLIRKVGTLTEKIHQFDKGDEIGIRGPYGNAFPLDKIKGKNLLIVVGGCGIAPLRGAIIQIAKHRKNFEKVIMFYGVRNPKSLIFSKDLKQWAKNIDLLISFDNLEKGQKPNLGCVYQKGLVTSLFKKIKIPDNLVAFLCGPPVVYKFVIQELKKRKVEDSDILMSLERRMECGVGVCEHCGHGPHYICKDGPVFSYDQVKGIKEEID